jgi:hypothetical protein
VLIAAAAATHCIPRYRLGADGGGILGYRTAVAHIGKHVSVCASLPSLFPCFIVFR